MLASEQIAYAVRAHPGKVTVLVPHYAMSGGTLIALAADEILMDESAVLGPVDPQLGDMPAAALVRVAAKKPIERLDDRTLLLADLAEKALRHMKQVVRDLLADRLGDDRADTIAEELAGGHYTHDDPITVSEASALGLQIATGLPREAYDLMELYPQEGRRRPSVQFSPLPDQPRPGPPTLTFAEAAWRASCDGWQPETTCHISSSSRPSDRAPVAGWRACWRSSAAGNGNDSGSPALTPTRRRNCWSSSTSSSFRLSFSSSTGAPSRGSTAGRAPPRSSGCSEGISRAIRTAACRVVPG